MSEYIDRQAVLETLKKTIAVNKNPNHDARVWEEGMNCAMTIIGAEPSADVQPVIHARWEIGTGFRWRCSKCGGLTYIPSKFCFNCGARTDGEQND